MGLIHDEIAECIIHKAIQMKCHTLYAAADHMRVGLLCAFNKSAHRHTGPKSAELPEAERYACTLVTSFLYNFFQQELLFKTTPLQCLFLPNLLQLLPSPASSPDY